jgi:hypothetical protein
VTFTGTSCGKVYDEMTARIAGNGGWVDPHNAGMYSVMEGSIQGKELHSKRLTGNKKYTDLQLFEFSEDGGDCVMTGCSESQVTSYLDFSTNYCNLHDLYCGSSDGCKFVKSDLKYKEDVKSCSSSDKGQCTPSVMFLEQKNVKPRGGDFDENGCRASLGQEYCAPLRKCIRPWEEKCEALEAQPVKEGSWCCSTCSPGFCGEGMTCVSVANPTSAMKSGKCAKNAVLGATSLQAGGDLDAHGCKHSTGEQYCEATKKCIRPWEEKCEAPKVLQAGGDLDAHGCKHSTGEQYCEATKKCIRPWEEKCEELGCSDCLVRQKRGENISCPMCVMTV